MLRRPATTLAITAEDIAAYEDRRARETMLRERQVLMQAQQQQQEHQQQRILQQQLAPQGLSSSPQRGHTPAEIQQLQQMQQAARFQQQQQQMQQQDADMTAESLQDYDEEQQEELLRRQQEMMRAQRGQQRAGLQTTPTPGDGGSRRAQPRGEDRRWSAGTVKDPVTVKDPSLGRLPIPLVDRLDLRWLAS